MNQNELDQLIAIVRNSSSKEQCEALIMRTFTPTAKADYDRINKAIVGWFSEPDLVKLTTYVGCEISLVSAMREAGIVPYVYIQRRTSSARAFRSNSTWLKVCLSDLVTNGLIDNARFDGFWGECFQVIKKPA